MEGFGPIHIHFLLYTCPTNQDPLRERQAPKMHGKKTEFFKQRMHAYEIFSDKITTIWQLRGKWTMRVQRKCCAHVSDPFFFPSRESMIAEQHTRTHTGALDTIRCMCVRLA